MSVSLISFSENLIVINLIKLNNPNSSSGICTSGICTHILSSYTDII